MIPKLRRKFISITAAALFAIILLVITAINGVFIYQNNKHLDSRLDLIMNRYPDGKHPEFNPSQDKGFPQSYDNPYNPDSELGYDARPGMDSRPGDIAPQNPDSKPDEIAPQNPDSKPGDTAPQNPDSRPGDTTPQNPDSKPDDGAPQLNDIPDSFGNIPESPEKPDLFFRPFSMDLLIRTDGCLILLNEDGSLQELLQDTSEPYSEEELASLAAELYHQGKESGWHQYFKYRMEFITLPGQTVQIKIGLINASSDLYSIFSMLLISITIGILSFLLVLFIIIIASGRAIKPIAESYTKQKQFVTDAGHELKTPLTVISANNELSKMIYGDSEWFDSIDSQITKMNGLIRSLITLARMDEEEQPVFTSFNLSDAVYDTAKSFEKLIHAQGKLITFDIADDVICLGDESKLRQLTAILMDNAAKYCDKQGKITVKLIEEKQIRLQITNDYAAAADCDLSRVFERFYRADKARTSDGSYGLGLSIAKSIAELHRGEIRARVLEHNRLMFEVILNHSVKKQNA